MLRAVATPTPAAVGTWRILAASAVAVSHTGDTNETTLATITVPGGAMGANGILRITTLWSYVSSANVKSMRTKFGGTGMRLVTAASNVTHREQSTIANRNATNSQIGISAGVAGGWGVSSSAINTASIDTTADQDIVISGQLAAGTETITLESYLVELFHQA